MLLVTDLGVGVNVTADRDQLIEQGIRLVGNSRPAGSSGNGSLHRLSFARGGRRPVQIQRPDAQS